MRSGGEEKIVPDLMLTLLTPYSLRSSSEMKIRMHIVQMDHSELNVAFLYDPIFVEKGEKSSYLIYWSRPDTNKALEEEILRHKEKDPVFHTFTYPLKEVGFTRLNREADMFQFKAEGMVLYWGAPMVGCWFVGRIVAT
jgi:hypothetical protein